MGIRTEQDCLNEISRISQAANDIKGAIEEKGVSVPEGTPLSDYDDLIRNISGGGDVSFPSGVSGYGSNGVYSITVDFNDPDFSYDEFNDFIGNNYITDIIIADGVISEDLRFKNNIDSEYGISISGILNVINMISWVIDTPHSIYLPWETGLYNYTNIRSLLGTLHRYEEENTGWSFYIIDYDTEEYVRLYDYLLKWYNSHLYFDSMSTSPLAYTGYIPTKSGEEIFDFRVMFANGAERLGFPQGTERSMWFSPVEFDITGKKGNNYRSIFTNVLDAMYDGDEEQIEMYEKAMSHFPITIVDSNWSTDSIMPEDGDNKLSSYWFNCKLIGEDIENLLTDLDLDEITNISIRFAAVFEVDGELVYNEYLFDDRQLYLRPRPDDWNYFNSEVRGLDNPLTVRENEGYDFFIQSTLNQNGPEELPTDASVLKPVYPRNFTITGNGGAYTKLISLEDALNGGDNASLYAYLLTCITVIPTGTNIPNTEEWYQIPEDRKETRYYYNAQVQISNLIGLKNYLGIGTLDSINCNLSGVMLKEDGSLAYTETLTEFSFEVDSPR